MHAIRFHFRPVRYILTRWLAGRRPSFALGPLGSVSLDRVPVPELPGPDWVRIETSISGVCGSDLAALTAHDSFTLEPFAAFPFTFGHENVGRIDQLGADVEGWEVGERVIVNPMLACRQRGFEIVCDPCAQGEYGLCRRTTEGATGGGPMIGYSPATGGGWAPYFLAHQSQLLRAGELDDEVAVLADPLASALRPVLLHPPKTDDTILIIGAGTIGILTIRALRQIGWEGEIIVSGRYPFQLELAEAAGADILLRSRDELYTWAGSLRDARSYKPSLAGRFIEGGPSLIYDTVGTEGSVRDSLALAREGGRIILVGAAAQLKADWTRLWYRQLTLAGVFAYGHAPYEGAERDIYEITIEELNKGHFTDLGMVTHIFPLEEYRAGLIAALDKSGHRSVKVAFRPNG